jgi:hypothetical protein
MGGKIEMTQQRLILHKKPGGISILLVTAFCLLIVASGTAFAQVVQLTVPLSGAQEVPPVATPATATGILTVNRATGAISGSVTFSGLTTPLTAGHIHMAPAGVNGAVIVPLLGGVGAVAGTMTVPPGAVLLPNQLTAFNNDGLYLNLHTSINPNGEIRGQILASSVWDEVRLQQVASGNFDSTLAGAQMAVLSTDGVIFVSLDLMSWIEIPGSFNNLIVDDFDGDGLDDIGGIDKDTGLIRITTDLGNAWIELVPPQR